MITRILTKDEIALAAELLKNGQVVGFPTETVYGLGVIYDNHEAFQRLIAIKKRPEHKPFTMMFADVDTLLDFVDYQAADERLIRQMMPGPLTLILPPKRELPSWVTQGEKGVGVRISDDPLVQALIKEVGKPLLVPSANRSQEPPLSSFAEVFHVFNGEVAALFSEDAKGRAPSSVVAISDGQLHCLRQGDLPFNIVEKCWKGEKTMKIAVGSDHGGYAYKKEIHEHLLKLGYEVIDCGTFKEESCDYPLFGFAAAQKVGRHEADFGILVCTTGEGIMIAANKVQGVRCALGYNDEVTVLCRQHNNANMIAFGQKFMELSDVIHRVDLFLETPFEGGRHARRVDLLDDFHN